jgi:hypothetical protein
MTITVKERSPVRDRLYARGAKLVGRWAVEVGAIGAVMWPVLLLINSYNCFLGDRLIRALLADPRWKPWVLASFTGGWVGSIVLLVSGRTFLRGSGAGRYGLIGCAVVSVALSVASAVINLTYLPAVVASLPPPARAWERLCTDWKANLASLLVGLAIAGSVIWLLTRPAIIKNESAATPD